ncbi:hypothetical protein DE146DRAFT_680111 [Phaeosphaeria sp. MPI-PUGE-AT-0046c]|nr:hypothetical protein DE146DRAFT_680111 [Phaeosphaeria sp. MPI-PUGE-AT-0046c]
MSVFTVHSINSTFAAQRIFEAMTIDSWDERGWTATQALKPLLSFLIALSWALYILAYPPKYRKISIAVLSVPVSHAFYYHTLLAPSNSVCDTFGRFLYIWLARMSHEMVILEWSPPIIKENDGWRSRLKSAYKVLFARNPEQNVLFTTPRHNYSRRKFLAYHAIKAIFYYFLQNAYWVLARYCIEAYREDNVNKGQFFRRLPDSLDPAELWERFDTVMVWCVCNLWLYDAFHSLFALFFVSLRFDAPGEWSMSLFGPLSEAWSVRRYWGKHWHNYIYHSFSGHTKVVTRGWLGMRRGHLSTRLIENTMVFAASGVMHTAVRWVQSGGDGGDYWVITFWYMGQMVPIIIEDVVQKYWRQKKKELGIKDSKWLLRAERVLGYLWVFGFNAWSITKYQYTREVWGQPARDRRYAALLEEWRQQKARKEMEAGMKIEL